ncbi:hypothetical protein L3X23_17805 [Pseudonocardia sp. WMMC193]|nr:hypothetical protein [Pseudonocardia sp. WMMC193]
MYKPRLGDGRALLLGELPDGRDLHLKGTGPVALSMIDTGSLGIR